MSTQSEGDAEKRQPDARGAYTFARKLLDDYRSSRLLPLLADPDEDYLFRRREREFLSAKLLGNEHAAKPLDVRLRWQTGSEGPLLCVDDLPEEFAQRVAAVAYSKYVPLWQRSTNFAVPSAENPAPASSTPYEAACDGEPTYRLSASSPSAEESSCRSPLAVWDGDRGWVEARFDLEKWAERQALDFELTFVDEPHLAMAELLIDGAIQNAYTVQLDPTRRTRGSLRLFPDREGSRELGIRIRDARLEDWLQNRIASPFHLNDVEAHVVSALRSRDACAPGGVSFIFCRKEGEQKRLARELSNGVWTIRVREIAQ